uniref:Uncharacterized protein n=1 Tax=Mycena chlorophos TaxID=658473 RepID=A0ABQ0LHN4_MYCCL|nr:predicted protein [Mycena chlorophos]
MKRPTRGRAASSEAPDSEPERVSQRRRLQCPSPAPSTRRPLASIENHPAPQPAHRQQKRLEMRLGELEDRVSEMEKQLQRMKEHGSNAQSSSRSPPPLSPFSQILTPPLGTDSIYEDRNIRASLEKTFRSMKQQDPELYLLPQPVRDDRGLVRRLGRHKRQ